MSTYKEWNDHFDRIQAVKLKAYVKAIEILRNDPMIKLNYGHDLESLKALINASNNMRKR